LEVQVLQVEDAETKTEAGPISGAVFLLAKSTAESY